MKSEARIMWAESTDRQVLNNSKRHQISLGEYHEYWGHISISD